MSICFRHLPCKLTSLVGPWNQIVQLDCRLTRLISTSTFLHEDKKISSRANVNTELPLNLTTYKKLSIDLKNLGTRLYSTAPELSKKPIDTSVGNKYSEAETNEDGNKEDVPKQQLEHVYKTLQDNLPKFFVTTHDYRIYTYDLEFINNYRGVRTKGLNSYIKQILILRVMGHVMYAYVKFDILKITMHPEEHAVKVRWRIRGLSSFRVLLNFRKLRLTGFNDSLRQLETWHDGFSTFYLDSNGKVYKHVADKMMPDEEREEVKAKPNIAAKLAA